MMNNKRYIISLIIGFIFYFAVTMPMAYLFNINFNGNICLGIIWLITYTTYCIEMSNIAIEISKKLLKK